MKKDIKDFITSLMVVILYGFAMVIGFGISVMPWLLGWATIFKWIGII